MTSDEDLQKLALVYSKEQGDDCLTHRTHPNTPVGECLTLFCGCDIDAAYQAGFRACEKMMADRLPTDIEMSREYGRHGMIREWLKQKLLGDE